MQNVLKGSGGREKEARVIAIIPDEYYILHPEFFRYDIVDNWSPLPFKKWLVAMAPEPEIRNEKAEPVFYPKPELKRRMMACNRWD